MASSLGAGSVTSDVALTSFSLALSSCSGMWTFLDWRCSDTLRPPPPPPPRARRSSTLAALRMDARCLVGVSSCWSFPARPPRLGEDTLLEFSSTSLFPTALKTKPVKPVRPVRPASCAATPALWPHPPAVAAGQLGAAVRLGTLLVEGGAADLAAGHQPASGGRCRRRRGRVSAPQRWFTEDGVAAATVGPGRPAHFHLCREERA